MSDKAIPRRSMDLDTYQTWYDTTCDLPKITESGVVFLSQDVAENLGYTSDIILVVGMEMNSPDTTQEVDQIYLLLKQQKI